jgi:hypothetical protein
MLQEKQIIKPSLPDLIIRPFSRQSSGLEGLPAEIVDHITDYLSARSALALHCCSKSLSEKVPIDDRFWKSHLCNGSLLLHLWDVDEQELKQRTAGAIEWDWKALIKRLSVEFNQDYKSRVVPPGLWNRRRILNYIEEILESSYTFPNQQNLSEPSIRASNNDETSANSNLRIFLVVLVAAIVWGSRNRVS